MVGAVKPAAVRAVAKEEMINESAVGTVTENVKDVSTLRSSGEHGRVTRSRSPFQDHFPLHVYAYP